MVRRFTTLLTLASALFAAPRSATDLAKGRELVEAGKPAAARALFGAIAHDVNSDAPARTAALGEMSRLDLATGRYSDAIKEGSESAALAAGLKDRAAEGNALTATGLARLYSGDYLAALRDMEASLACANDTRDDAAVITRLNNIGNAYYFQGRYTEALAQYEHAGQALAHTSPEKLGERVYRARRQLTTANLATVYQRLGQYNRALDLYAGLNAGGSAMRPAEQAQLLANMGALYRRLGDPIKALETYRAARTLYQGNKLRSGEIAVLNNIGIAQALDLHHYQEALASFNEALTMARTSGDRPVGLHALLYRGQTWYRQMRLADAAHDFTEAAALARELKATEEEWKALYGLARIARDGGDHQQARTHLEAAIALIESIRGNVAAGSLRGGFLADKREVYDLALAEAVGETLPDTARVFHLMEQSRARTLQDKPGAVAATRSLAVAATRSLADIRHLLPDDTILLEYWASTEGTAVLWATRDAASVRSVAAGPEFRVALNRLAAALSNPGDSSWKAAADAVAAPLLTPLAEVLQGRHRRLVIASDNELWKIPFEVLTYGGQPLIQRYSVSYLPSGSLLRAATNGRAIRMPWHRSILGFANPAAGRDAPLDIPGAGSRADLPGADAELRAVAGLLGGAGDLFFGAQAAKRELNQASGHTLPVLHLATHAWADPEDPARSWMLFAPASGSLAFDYLFLKEAAGLDLKGVSLVTASACETEAGRFLAGEGVESFGRAFLEAGVGAVVTSLWPVSDRGAADLMSRFYRKLAQGREAGDALSDARRELSQSAHPALWAAFVLSGDAGIRLPWFARWYQLIAAALIIVAALAFLARHRQGIRTRAKRA